jgi:MFS superfamily sulfate permease-like transporter
VDQVLESVVLQQGLAAIVLTAIGTLGSFENFLLAVVLGGAIQFIFGILRAGVIGYYFPSSVIKGMLTGIGIIIILKQIPYFFGYNSNFQEGSLAYFSSSTVKSFVFAILNSINFISPGATIVAVLALWRFCCYGVKCLKSIKR